MKKVVIIGASNNPLKYGNKIVKDLVIKGFQIFPINLKEDSIEGMKCYKDLEELTMNYDYVVFVISPEAGLDILKRHKNALKNKKIWFQPGSSSVQIVDFLRKNFFIDYVTDSCIMLDTLNI